jgi:hypothetical protein
MSRSCGSIVGRVITLSFFKCSPPAILRSHWKGKNRSQTGFMTGGHKHDT